jgi:hypothetical protein
MTEDPPTSGKLSAAGGEAPQAPSGASGPQGAAQAPSTAERFAQLGWQALPAIGSAVGFVTFVAIIGGAIEWVRFSAAGLPADQAVRVVPKAQLVTIGAVELVIFFVGGLLALLVVYLLDRKGNASVPTFYGLLTLTVIEMLASLILIHEDYWVYLLLAVWFLALGALAGLTLVDIPKTLRERSVREDAEAQLRAARQQLEVANDAFDAATSAYERKVRPADKPDDTISAKLDDATISRSEAERRFRRALSHWRYVVRGEKTPPPEPGRSPTPTADRPHEPLPSEDALRSEDELEAWLRQERARGRFKLRQLRPRLAPLVGLGLVVVVGLALVLAFRSTRWIAIMFAVVLFLGAANFGVARATSRFAWYGFGVFISIAVFGAALTIVRAIRRPSVQPAALVRKSDDVAMCGVYITETADRVYLGRVEQQGDHAKRHAGRIFWVPTSDIDVVSVAPLQPIRDANARAIKLIGELYTIRAEEAAPKVEPTTTTSADTTNPTTTTTTVTQTPVKPDRPKKRPTPKLPTECSPVHL